MRHNQAHFQGIRKIVDYRKEENRVFNYND